ncbi:nudix-type nucleoside diphosphatase, YffH/AdpP family [Loktanella fryxellensis]|uniref:ADP-ribose pyrophosphatase n=1 Tax=Loktanella fryxellensis TaxID=245187 RepID=A0A1H8I0I6_9RHOB|nr:NUDIX domain-containing protein [Loktanella fryxellensis]SEN61892.1 nudix-type nucleoside diphosphatase, YffH/AdpP family [Loktanella fryxellensis]
MDLFLWGPLLDADLCGCVTGVPCDAVPAVLQGMRVQTAADGGWPMLLDDATASVEGRLIRNPGAGVRQQLSAWHALVAPRPLQVVVAVDGTPCPATLWTGRGAAGAGADWSLATWQTGHGPVWRAAAAELFAHGLPDMDAARWQFPVMLKRAWAQACAARDPRPATLRHAAQVGDVSVTDRAPPLGRFFRLQGFDVTHRRFDGQSQGPLPREVMVGVDAVMVLPYDPQRDQVLLVEQIRMGVLLRGDPNPWMLEPVAGMIDAFETPEQAALRETREEAGLDVILRHVASFYPSPGNATDYFHTYVGLCDLPDDMARIGGLADEHEDLALHLLSLDDAMALVTSGEIAVGPCISLICWLALHRAALRLEFASPAA